MPVKITMDLVLSYRWMQFEVHIINMSIDSSLLLLDVKDAKDTL